jgi:hypothetical protein
VFFLTGFCICNKGTREVELVNVKLIYLKMNLNMIAVTNSVYHADLSNRKDTILIRKLPEPSFTCVNSKQM